MPADAPVRACNDARKITAGFGRAKTGDGRPVNKFFQEAPPAAVRSPDPPPPNHGMAVVTRDVDAAGNDMDTATNDMDTATNDMDTATNDMDAGIIDMVVGGNDVDAAAIDMDGDDNGMDVATIDMDAGGIDMEVWLFLATDRGKRVFLPKIRAKRRVEGGGSQRQAAKPQSRQIWPAAGGGWVGSTVGATSL
jgi:hypothetical protein